MGRMQVTTSVTALLAPLALRAIQSTAHATGPRVLKVGMGGQRETSLRSRAPHSTMVVAHATLRVMWPDS